ncbi:selenoneine biosynthesis selenosugar synthase SenB [Noviherbaspirillum pedocola]|uniref:TIGR04348 family glycosyltransferase n=1 Tax=Noviherbaspirillum pedocola TaxID=2801341 RepID=A0A934T391_9BURK|nr:selenoneine biosynthesis selenosugar synthase SenB [Noviherbaspirillum pedocola]MBK4737543.1 TIGR04348 family glycosyltransferase [Noviherbaspirillum pedocola]
MNKANILIISPATVQANNGNWRTAQRWAGFLSERYHVDIAINWLAASTPPDAMIALHARRSASALLAFATTGRPAILALTGTDLYHDIHSDTLAQRALHAAARLVLLQPAGLAELPRALLPRAHVIYQSAPALPRAMPAVGSPFSVVMIGHLRQEKDPLTFMRAAALASAPALRFLQIGRALQPELEAAAQDTAQRCPAYAWLGELPHDDAREQLRRSHLLALPSLMEGGANVLIEAVTSGVPVVASDVSGNRGMLGEDYAGYFPVGDAASLAALIDRAAGDTDFYRLLCEQCAARAPLFAPEHEQASLLALVDNALLSHRNP